MAKPAPILDGAPPWITTFVDMISLLVTFFILLFTFSSIDAYDSFTFKQNFLGTRGTIKTASGESSTDPPNYDVMSAMNIKRGAQVPHVRPPDKVAEDLEEMGQQLTKEHIEFDPKQINEGVVLQFDARASFAPGSVDVNTYLHRSLAELGQTMEHYTHTIVIEGHTDSEFKPTLRYPTAEALSIARARAAADVLLKESRLSPELVQVTGLGMSRPVAGNETPGERQQNRRVEVRIQSLEKTRALALDWKEGRSWAK